MRYPRCAGLRVTLSVPPYASLGDMVSMGCQFDVGSSSLYSVKWYKDGDEFCRYTPAYHPQIQLFPVKGIVMDEKGCQMTTVTLKNAKIETTGSYRCEVSTESPNFETVFRTENLTVRDYSRLRETKGSLRMRERERERERERLCRGEDDEGPAEAKPYTHGLALPSRPCTFGNFTPLLSKKFFLPLPNRPPQIRGLNNAYEPGEWVVTTCTAGRSLPAATLEWLLNGRPVEDKSWVTGSVIKTSQDVDDDDDWTLDEDDDDFDQDLAEVPQQPLSNDGDKVFLWKSRSTLRFQARTSQFVGPTHELVLRCEARVHEKSWRTEGKAAMAGPGGKQHLLSHIELQHNMAGECIEKYSIKEMKGFIENRIEATEK
ncbi:hypothetical protein B566_EDAN012296 [Ephemera danica]|nr:hypothetical protein B566_EDAN012296 [Ephemera danica]